MEKIYKKIPLGQAKDITNQRFGHLTALYRTVNNKTQTMWVCKCDCGTIKPMAMPYFTKAKDPSCGCQNRIKASTRMKKYNANQRTIQIGDRFGKLVVIKYEGLRKQASRDKNESWYICQCDCGNIKSIRGNDLSSGAVISCGCISSRGEEIIKDILNNYNINYKTEYTFPDLRNPLTNYRLRFDFAIFDKDDNLQYLIEFDGKQHYTGPDTNTWSHTKDTLEDIQFRDNLKNEYCKKNNIILKRIPYTSLSHLNYDEIISSMYNIV